MKRHDFATLFALLALVIGNRCLAADRPNILLILADDVGQDALGCYGGESYGTPHLDQLAASGMRFTHNFTMPVCHPTRIALLTGRYPFRLDHPAWGSYPRSAESQTVTHAIRLSGYRTAIAGKWQLALLRDDPTHPQRLGFDDYCLFGWHEGPRYYEPMIYQNGALRQDVADRYGPDVYVDFLIDFMQRSRERPFFAFYSMALCHDVTDDLEQPVPHGPQDRYDTFHEMVEAMDQRVGRLIGAVSEIGIRDNTLILFTTDNGSPSSYIHSAGSDGQLVRRPVTSRWRGTDVPGGKGKLTDTGTNVPLIANWPRTIAAGRVVGDLVDVSDFYATLVEIAGAEPAAAPQRDSVSFAGRLQEERPSSRQWTFAEQGNRAWVRDRRWKLYDDGRLFDIEQDPWEDSAVLTGSAATTALERLQPVMKELGWSQPRR